MAKLNAEELLAAYHSGKANEEQKAIVETWYLSVPGAESGFSDEELIADKNRSISGLLDHIGQKRSHRLWWSASIAASVFLLAIASFFYLNTDKKSDHKDTILVSDIAAGGARATLTLADGKKIDLTKAANGNLAGLAGVEVQKTAGGELIYTVKPTSSGVPVVQHHTIQTPNGGQYQVKLQDGTVVYLNAASTIKYPTIFTGKDRTVEVSGEAYLQVAHNKAKPFRVISTGQVIEVLGTEFNISAYKDEALTRTTLIQGAVKISSLGKSRQLIPGQQSQVSPNGIMVSNDINTAEVIAWKDGYFMFNERLESIMNKLARWYDVDVEYKGGVDMTQEFGGRISRHKKLSSALKIMELTGNVHFKIEGRRVIVMK